MKKYLAGLLLAIILTGCGKSSFGNDSTPGGLNNMTKPIIITAIDSSGNVVLKDKDGYFKVFPGTYYFSMAIKGAGYKTGDTLR